MKPGRITRTDKTGEPFVIGTSGAEDFSCLCEMYHAFQPKAASQGLPPEDPEICRNWIIRLFQIGENLLAWRGSAVIGHAALIPDKNGRSGEFIIFVDQNNRNLGIGTELTRFALEKSRELGLGSVWLTVHLLNTIAIKLYRKFDFKYGDRDNYERVMSIELRSSNSDQD